MDAIGYYEQALGLDPEFSEAYANKALVHGQLKQNDLAIESNNKALGIDPNLMAVKANLIYLYRQNADWGRV